MSCSTTSILIRAMWRRKPPRRIARGATAAPGLGLTLTRRDAAIVVQEAVSDGPAALAGIGIGDTIVAVDGQSVRELDTVGVERLMAGPEGTSVHLTLAAARRQAALSRCAARDGAAGDGVHRLDRRTCWCCASPASATAPQRTSAYALQDWGWLAPATPPASSWICAATAAACWARRSTRADMLLPAGIVATTAGRDPDADHVFRPAGGELAEDMPVVVLVDGRTASAAEILAAALADRGRAVVVGSSTLGKGLVQTIDPLPDGGELFVTWSRVLAPRGWPIQGLGVVPQVCTSQGEAALHRQLVALAEGLQPMWAELMAHRAARAPLPPTQMVAIRNACPAGEGREIDFAAARTLIDNPAAYAAALLPPMRLALQP